MSEQPSDLPPLDRIDEPAADQAEAERRRLARLLDRRVVDSLNLLLAQLSAYEQTLSAHQPSRLALAVLASLAQRVLQQVRDLEESLRPAVLDELGLEAALETLASQTRRVYGLQVTCALDWLPDRPPSHVALALFRLAQDAIERAAEPARARQAHIRLERRAELLVLTLADDGAPEAERELLHAARERIARLGGSVEADVGPHGGLRLVAAIPVAPAPDLTPREREVLRLLTRGMTNKAIARALGVSPRTVNFHLDNLYAKLGVASRTEAVLAVLRQGWLPRET